LTYFLTALSPLFDVPIPGILQVEEFSFETPRFCLGGIP